MSQDPERQERHVTMNTKTGEIRPAGAPERQYDEEQKLGELGELGPASTTRGLAAGALSATFSGGGEPAQPHPLLAVRRELANRRGRLPGDRETLQPPQATVRASRRRGMVRRVWASVGYSAPGRSPIAAIRSRIKRHAPARGLRFSCNRPQTAIPDLSSRQGSARR
jgi:hypothetical protein